MNLLQLVNNVLTRLREDETSQEQLALNQDPYLRSVVAHVNDAKSRVEDAWEWSMLRGVDSVPLDPTDGPNYLLPNSQDSSYVLQGFYASDTAATGDAFYPLRQVSKQRMINVYRGGYDNAPVNRPSEVAVMATDQDTGLIRVSVWPRMEVGTDAVLIVNRVSHQPTLTADTPRMFVPSLPVYTLATALASRERGEVGGTPTSELFAIADGHLSDAIAIDSALFPTELDWYSAGEQWVNTNVKNA
jgi:hypothetical protein